VSLLSLFATAPRSAERQLAEELESLGAEAVERARGGVAFQGTLETAYRVCLWSRCASRILLLLDRVPAPDPEALYQGVRAMAWEQHLPVEGTLAVRSTVVASAIEVTRP